MMDKSERLCMDEERGEWIGESRNQHDRASADNFLATIRGGGYRHIKNVAAFILTHYTSHW